MRVCVMGSSVLVTSLIQQLLEEGHEVVQILADAGERSSVTSEDEALETVVGSGPLLDLLKEAETQRVEAFLALSENENRNAMAAQIAHRLFKVPRTVCLIDDQERAGMYERLGLTVVCPTSLAAEVVEQVLER